VGGPNDGHACRSASGDQPPANPAATTRRLRCRGFYKRCIVGDRADAPRHGSPRHPSFARRL
jgi:hypothetical protein